MPSKRRPAKQRKGWEASLSHVVAIMRGPTLKTQAATRAIELSFLYQGQLPIPPKRQLS
jgi:hypothetical protein